MQWNYERRGVINATLKSKRDCHFDRLHSNRNKVNEDRSKGITRSLFTKHMGPLPQRDESIGPEIYGCSRAFNLLRLVTDHRSICPTLLNARREVWNGP